MTKAFDIPKKLIWEAFKCVKANGGAAGVDHESIEKFESDLSNNLYKLWNRMCAGSYIPPPVRAVPIPKKTGGVRILGVPTVADRVAQAVREAGELGQVGLQDGQGRAHIVGGVLDERAQGTLARLGVGPRGRGGGMGRLDQLLLRPDV